MNITIDTKNKVITVNEEVNLKDFLNTVMEMFPENWEEYKLDVRNEMNWWYPYWQQPVITTATDGSGEFTADTNTKAW